ncbi:MAG: ribbon-helix-helix protein, CopG family [Thermoplasmata archaeon]
MPVTTVRLDDETLRRLDRLAEREGVDRATVIRRALERGMRQILLNGAAVRYQRGECSAARAAEDSAIPLWEFLEFLRQRGIPFRTDEEHLEALLEEL